MKIPSQVEIVGFEKCAKQHGNYSADEAKMICAGGHKKGACFVSILASYAPHIWPVALLFTNHMIRILLCQGDSGGPLTKNGVLVGVVSGGDSTGSSCNADVSLHYPLHCTNPILKCFG